MDKLGRHGRHNGGNFNFFTLEVNIYEVIRCEEFQFEHLQRLKSFVRSLSQGCPALVQRSMKNAGC